MKRKEGNKQSEISAFFSCIAIIGLISILSIVALNINASPNELAEKIQSELDRSEENNE